MDMKREELIDQIRDYGLSVERCETGLSIDGLYLHDEVLQQFINLLEWNEKLFNS